MPAHIAFLLRHAFVGFLIAAGFAAVLLVADFGGLRHLVLITDGGFVALAAFVVFCTITFGSVQIGVRIMMMAERPSDDGGRGLGQVALAEPVPVRVDR
ncbi:hypothetical protein HKCCE2091_10490 [Rhodobacterales bacterium HKCCE2091]|nr:hypothetical protein [Rhodobacterales bacterium HKCCE2091]